MGGYLDKNSGGGASFGGHFVFSYINSMDEVGVLEDNRWWFCFP
jgi:hypothetical protein